ncbi:MAG TPA: helix-turn-helix domain-containing protein [Armatimonadota bacterium]
MRLTSTELVVYVALVRHWDPMSRVSAPSFAEIGRELGVDRGTVIRAMRTLEALGLARKTIRTGEDGGSLSNQYALPLEDQADDAEAASGRQA